MPRWAPSWPQKLNQRSVSEWEGESGGGEEEEATRCGEEGDLCACVLHFSPVILGEWNRSYKQKSIKHAPALGGVRVTFSLFSKCQLSFLRNALLYITHSAKHNCWIWLICNASCRETADITLYFESSSFQQHQYIKHIICVNSSLQCLKVARSLLCIS